MTEKWNILTFTEILKKCLVLKEENLWTALILKCNGLQEVLKFQCIFSNYLNCAMWIDSSIVFIFSDLIPSDLSRGHCLSLRIWGFFYYFYFFLGFSSQKTWCNDPFSQQISRIHSVFKISFFSEIPGHLCEMSMSEDLSSVRGEFLWGTRGQCLVLDRLPGGRSR